MRIALKPTEAEFNTPAFFISMYAGVVPPILVVAAIEFILGDDGAFVEALDQLITLLGLFSGSFIAYFFVRRQEHKSEPPGSPPLTYLPTRLLGWYYGIAFGIALFGLEAILRASL